MPPVLSIVVPCYNYGRYLGDCLESICRQVEPPPFEVLVIDDGSTDHTVDVLKSFPDPRIRVIHHEHNLGHVATINEALPLTRGSIVARIDPDDRYRPHFMKTVHTKLMAHPDVGLVYGRAALIDAEGRRTGQTTAEPHVGEFRGSEFIGLMARNFICAPTVAARREAWLAALPVPDGLAFHDWFFTLLISRRHSFCFVDDVLADYRVHATNHHATISRDRSEERSVLYLLDRVFAETEPDPSVDATKRRAKGRVYAAHYLDFADKYFGFGMNADARRCYLAAARSRPGSLTRPGVARRLAATVVGRGLYERLKASRHTLARTR